MTTSVKQFLETLQKGTYRAARIDNSDYDLTELTLGIPVGLQNTVMLEDMLRRETPYFPSGDRFGFNRTLMHLPCILTTANGKQKKRCTFGGNLTPNYRRIIESGLDDVLSQIEHLSEQSSTQKQRVFYEAMRRSVRAVCDLCDRYRDAAERNGLVDLANALSQVPRRPARSFYEACVFLKLLIFSLRCSGVNHMTLGRFDQYMLSYYLSDLERGISREALLETLELFFISLNLDGDLYDGIQMGDNGQSMVLGGYDKSGKDLFNDLSALCMDASLELSLIDPKINLRVNKKTPLSRYEYGTKLTKQGLGFPQYCNDDVFVPYLISLGYDEADAYNYTVAACWEVISPNNGADECNRAVLELPKVVDRTVRAHLSDAETFEDLLAHVHTAIEDTCAQIRKDYIAPPSERNFFLSVLIDGCLEKGLDYTQGGAKYNNYGCFAAGISTAADALAAVKQTVYVERSVSPCDLLAALERNFEGYETLRHNLLACPKMGNNDDRADAIADDIMTVAENAMHNQPTGRLGGIWRLGTGTAQMYMERTQSCPATADGRLSGDAYGCNYSPSLSVKLNGPLSVIQSFTKHDMSRIANGGPLTLEVHDTVFRSAEGERKIAQLVQAFINLGGHQLQLNAINRDRLLDAQKHPERYPNLIVRVWGWSGYFCELDKKYQDHIIRRTEFSV